MQTKLTLRLDKELIDQAKAFSQQTGKSLSKIVSDYLTALVQKEQEGEELTPLVKSLRGILKDADGKVDVEDYHHYLEEKYK